MIKTGVHQKNLNFYLKRSDQLMSQLGIRSNSRMFNRPLMLESLNYALGNQERWRYKKRPDEITDTDRETKPTSDWRNSKLMFHLVQTLVTLIKGQRLSPSVTGIDMLSRAAQQELEINLRMASINKQIGAAYETYAHNAGISPEEVPVTDDGLKMRLAMRPQLREEMNFELGISQMLNIYGFDEIDTQIIKTAVTTNLNGVCIDLDSCMPNIRVVNPLNAYCNHSDKEDCSDISEGCEVILVPLWKLEAYAKDQFNDWEVVKAKARPYEQIVTSTNFSGYGFIGAYDSTVLYVPVLHGSWVETRDVYAKTVITKDGDVEHFLDIDMDLNDKRLLEYKKKPYQFVYTFKRVLDTTEFYDTGLLEPQMRYLPVNNPADKTLVDPRTAQLNWIFSNPNNLFGVSNSFPDLIKPEMDSLQRVIDKFNSIIQSAIPQTMEINFDLLAEIKMGDQKWSVDRLIQLFERKGILLKSKNTSYTRGPHDSPDAIKVYSNNVYANAQSLLDIWNALENKIYTMAGIAATQLGKSAGDRVSQGLNESMIQGQNNVLGGYYRSRNKLFSRLCFQLYLWLQYKGGSGVYEGRDYEIDPAEMRNRLFNITTEVEPSDAQWDFLQQSAIQAYNSTPRELDFADLMIIQFGSRKNYKQLASYFAERQRVKTEMNNAKEERMIQLNNQGASEAADRKAQGEIAKIQTKEQLVTQRTGLEQQAKGMMEEAGLKQMSEAEYLEVLSKVNADAANRYVLAKLGIPFIPVNTTSEDTVASK